MADMLMIGSLATNSFKKALEVTGHNVANIGTEGYHRQSAVIKSNSPQIVGTTFLGGGSYVDKVDRIYSQHIQNQLVTSQSSLSRYEEQAQLAKQVEGVVASNDTGVQEFMQRFFDAMQNLSDNPTSTTSARMLLDESTNIEAHIGNIDSVLKDTQEQVNNQIRDTANEVNSRVATISAINAQVERAYSTGNQAPNDLLDQREQAILELSQYMDIKPYHQENGRVDIYTGDGRLPLISDVHTVTLDAAYSEFSNENRMELYMSIGGERRLVSNQVTGGSLGGVLDFRSNMLDKSMNDLGLTINGVVASVNWQHYQGWDLEGNEGQNFFNPLSTTALGSSQNTGSEDGSGIQVSFNPNPDVAEPPYISGSGGVTEQPLTYGEKETYLQTAFDALGELKSREYLIKSDGAGGFNFFDHKTGEDLTANAVENPVGRFQLDGLEFDFTGALASNDGDKFLVKPHQAILSNFHTAITDSNALATRGQTPIDSNNDGSLDDEVPSPAAYGDNVNMANMANLASMKLLYADSNQQASETLLGGYSRMATSVGMYVRGTEIQLSAQTNVFNQIKDRMETESGVSLDEEAANLMKFQQAYQAAAQLISTSQTLFQTLIGVVGRG